MDIQCDQWDFSYGNDVAMENPPYVDELWKYTSELLENDGNHDNPVASICGSSLAAWFL